MMNIDQIRKATHGYDSVSIKSGPADIVKSSEKRPAIPIPGACRSIHGYPAKEGLIVHLDLKIIEVN